MLNLDTMTSYKTNFMKKILFYFGLVLHSSKEQQISPVVGHDCGLPFKFPYWHVLCGGSNPFTAVV